MPSAVSFSPSQCRPSAHLPLTCADCLSKCASCGLPPQAKCLFSHRLIAPCSTPTLLSHHPEPLRCNGVCPQSAYHGFCIHCVSWSNVPVFTGERIFNFYFGVLVCLGSTPAGGEHSKGDRTKGVKNSLPINLSLLTLRVWPSYAESRCWRYRQLSQSIPIPLYFCPIKKAVLRDHNHQPTQGHLGKAPDWIRVT